MENKNVMMLRHHPMNVLWSNPFYTGQTTQNLGDYTIIDVTSRAERDKTFMAAHPKFARELSPFYIGPVTGPDCVTAQIFEIFWQCGKVYPCHDDNGKPNAAFFEWRNGFYAMEECSKDLMRHACKDLGYEHKDARYFAWFNKGSGEYEALDYVQARKKVYFREYAKLVVNTPSFQWLKSLVDKGEKIALVDFDGFNYNEERGLKGKYTEYLNKCKKNKTQPIRTVDDYLAVNSMAAAVSCPFMQVGHGFVLKALLQGDIEVVDGKIVDRAEILV